MTFPRLSTSWTSKTYFAKSRPIRTTCMISSFIAVDVRDSTPPRGRGPYHWPLGKRFYFGGERLAAFGHMSGLLARTGSAGPDEVRRPSAPNQGGELWAPDPLRSVRWSSIVSPCRSSRLRRDRQTLEPAFSFRVRCPRLKSGLGVDGGAEGLAGGDDRSDDPGELVGQRHGHDLGRFAGSERGQPVAQRALALWRRPQDRDGAQHKKPSDIPIALLGYRPEFLLAAGRVLFGRRAKPGGEIAAGFEGLRIWRAGQNRRSGERADAGDARRQSADRIASMVGDDRALELVGRRVERPQLRKQNSQRRLDHRRKVRGGGSLDEFLDVADPFGGYDTELRQMTPQGVHAHRALLVAVRGSCGPSAWPVGPRS